MTESLAPFGVIASRYRVERELGGGGMSSVFLAHDLKHGRKVAVKLMRSGATPILGPDRFTREIELTARLTHPHVLPLLDSGETDGTAYYVMPFIEGESLRDRLRRDGQLPLNDALRIAREVADALGYAHAHGVVHRDIKPENILLSAGHAVVADFGIARALSVAVGGTLTTVGLALGTPTYMSPEQAFGEEVDGRADLYALGCVLFEMLAGDLAFRAPTAAAMLGKKISGTVPDVCASRDSVPAEVGAIVQRALARDLEARFQSAQELIDALDAARGEHVTGRGPAAAVPVTAPAPHNSVAVLAFTARGGGPDDEYLGDGISEELMNALSRLGGLRVIARTSAFAFKKLELDVREIGRRLNVRRVVEGSVRRSGNRLRVTAKLIDAETAFEIWSERFEREVEDVFDIEDEIGTAIARALRGLLLSEGADAIPTLATGPGAPTASFAAYEQYLKGRHFWGTRTEEGFRRSVEHLERAIDLDPTFALAYAALADTLATMGLYGIAAPGEVMPLARKAAERAMSIKGDLAEALSARACVRAIYDWDWSGAEEDFHRAIAANPQYATAHQWLATQCLVPQGRFDEARASLGRARVLDPLSLSIAVSLTVVDYYERKYEDAAVSSRAVLELDDRFAMGHYFLGLALEQLGAVDESLRELARAVELSRGAEAMAALGHAYATAGEADRAREQLAELERRAASRYDSPVLLAQIALGLGERERALGHLRDARERRSADLMWVGVRPAFDALRSEPEFVRLLDTLHLL